MTRKTRALEIEMKRCVRVRACVRTCGDDGRMCDEEGTRGAATKEQEKIKEKQDLRIGMCGRVARSGDITTN